tara:strand:- start:113 stop:364 length:252 start_codon:yes stop_codon:yes gene_type:complete
MDSIKNKIEILKPLIDKAFKENKNTIKDVNLLYGYIWMYQGAEDELNFAEFFSRLLNGHFYSPFIIEKAMRIVKKEYAKKSVV